VDVGLNRPHVQPPRRLRLALLYTCHTSAYAISYVCVCYLIRMRMLHSPRAASASLIFTHAIRQRMLADTYAYAAQPARRLHLASASLSIAGTIRQRMLCHTYAYASSYVCVCKLIRMCMEPLQAPCGPRYPLAGRLASLAPPERSACYVIRMHAYAYAYA
jgi:hypothetical protein